MADRSVIVTLGANVTGYVSKLKHAGAVTKDFSSKGLGYAAKHEAGLTKLSNRAGLLGLGITAMAGLAVKAAMDWESASCRTLTTPFCGLRPSGRGQGHH